MKDTVYRCDSCGKQLSSETVQDKEPIDHIMIDGKISVCKFDEPDENGHTSWVAVPINGDSGQRCVHFCSAICLLKFVKGGVILIIFMKICGKNFQFITISTGKTHS